MTKDINSKALTFKKALSTERIKDTLVKVNDTKLSPEERYKQLTNIYFYFSAAYSTTHDSTIRDYVNNDLNEFAKKNFSNQYQSGDFEIPCADPICGHALDPEVKEVLSIITESKLPEDVRSVTLKNLTTSGYIPEKDQALFGYGLVLMDLDQAALPVASTAASILRKYVKSKYNNKL